MRVHFKIRRRLARRDRIHAVQRIPTLRDHLNGRWGLLSHSLCFVLTIGYAGAAWAGDWPQILGPRRDGVAENEKLAESWPANGPATLWQREVGPGFAGLAVAEKRAVLFHRQQDEEVAEAMDAATGKVAWRAAFPTSYVSTISPDDGPRCVPVIHAGNVYLYGAARNLHCVSLADGKTRWSRALGKEYIKPQEEGYFGAGSTPIVAGDRLLVNVGGAKSGAGLVALDLKTGKTLWKATDEEASYSSPVVARLNGVDQVVFLTRYNVVGVDPANGRVLWKFAFGARGPTVNAASPVVLDGHVFVSASYGLGAVYAKLGGAEPKELWRSEEMSSQFATSVALQGYLYGVDGRDDSGQGHLRCLDAATGKVVWSEDGFGVASLILADGKLLLQKTSGQLVLARATPKGYEPLAEADVLDEKTYALGALADGLYYLRDSGTLKCLDLRK